MLLSLEKRFLFVHVPKAAGSSITAALRPYSLPANRTLPRRMSSHFPFAEDARSVYLRTHDTALHAKKKLGVKVFGSLLKFAVVRDPYTHAASLYSYRRQDPKHRHHTQISSMTFVEFLEHMEAAIRKFDQSMFLVDRSGAIIVDRILKFENLTQDFGKICSDLDIPEIELPFSNVTKKMNSDTFLCDRSRALIERIYKRDFTNFDYEMKG